MAVWVKNAGVWKRTIGGIDPHNGTAFQEAEHNYVFAGGGWKDARPFEDQAMTMTVATEVIFSYTPSRTPFPVDVSGYDAASADDYYGTYNPTLGALDSGADWFDTIAVDRNIVAFYWVESYAAQNAFLYLSVAGINVPNIEDTFYSVLVNSTEFLRTDAVYIASRLGSTHWYWENILNPFGLAGSKTITMRGKSGG